jgi:hypothetical protein
MAKPGPKSVGPSAKGSSPSGDVAGGPGKSTAQKPYQGPTNPGPPASMRKALAKKPIRGTATGAAGVVR